MLFSLCLLVALAGVLLFLRHPKFGKLPAGQRLTRSRQSPNFRDGQFRNAHTTPDLKEGVGYGKVLVDFLFRKSDRSKPTDRLPSQKTNLLTLPPTANIVVWFGHSSYFLQIDGKTILVDPVLSGSASPVAFTTKSFSGSDVYTVDDIPAIDYLFLSHDHWDHLDYATIRRLRPRIKTVLTGLGTGAHLEHWGFAPDQIIEKDWNETVTPAPGFSVTVTPARHFSGRSLTRNRALWVSFVLKTPTQTIFIGGDSGYDTHFAAIGAAHGPFDLAILECGQYHAYWPYIHMMPEEVVRAAQDLRARQLMPVHWAKFELALHAWDDPIIRVTAEAERTHMPILTPMIGEAVSLPGPVRPNPWWTAVK